MRVQVSVDGTLCSQSRYLVHAALYSLSLSLYSMFWHVTGTSSPFTATKPTLLKTDRALLSHDKQHRLWWYPDAADSFNPISSQWKRFNRVRFCFVQGLHLNGIYDVNWKILVFKNTFVNFFTIQSDQIMSSFSNDLSFFFFNICSISMVCLRFFLSKTTIWPNSSTVFSYVTCLLCPSTYVIDLCGERVNRMKGTN